MAFPTPSLVPPQWNPRSPAPPRAGLLHVVLVLNRTKLNLLLPFFGLSASAIFAQRFVRGRRGKEEASDGGNCSEASSSSRLSSIRYPSIVRAAANLPCQSAIIDGEAIVQDGDGASDFEALSSAMRRQPHSIILYALSGDERSRFFAELERLATPRAAFKSSDDRC